MLFWNGNLYSLVTHLLVKSIESDFKKYGFQMISTIQVAELLWHSFCAGIGIRCVGPFLAFFCGVSKEGSVLADG